MFFRTVIFMDYADSMRNSKCSSVFPDFFRIDWIGHESVREKIYFLVDGNLVYLFGLSPRFSFDEIKLHILEQAPTGRIQAIFILDFDCLVAEVLKKLEQNKETFDVILPVRPRGFDVSVFSNLCLIYANETEYSYVSPDEKYFQIIPAFFVNRIYSAMVYSAEDRLLLSNHLFDLYPNTSEATRMQTLLDYHRENIPSSNFLRPLLKEVSTLTIEHLFTSMGWEYGAKEIRTASEKLETLDFYNYYRNNEKTEADDSEKIIVNLLDQIIAKLRTLFGSETVKETFSSNAAFDPVNFSFSASGKEVFKLWHQAFEQIYLKKGQPWLDVLYPLVSKFVETYHVAFPNIYTALSEREAGKISLLTKEKELLEKQLTDTKDKLESAKQKLLVDKATGLYNELFLYEYLTQEIKRILDKESKLGDITLIYVCLDNILEINSKYSKASGDEALASFAYLIKQEISSEDLIFKQNGPGFIIMSGDMKKEDAFCLISHIQASVIASETFIEPVTASASLVNLSEFYGSVSPDVIARGMLSSGDHRIKLARQKGPSSVIDSVMEKEEEFVYGSVLVVSDEGIAGKLMNAFFSQANFECIIATDGQKALEIAKNRKFDAIIADKNTPKIDGISLKGQLNESFFTAQVPFILTTYDKSVDTIRRANRAGVDYVIQKPLIFEEILGLIQRHLKRNGDRP